MRSPKERSKYDQKEPRVYKRRGAFLVSGGDEFPLK